MIYYIYLGMCFIGADATMAHGMEDAAYAWCCVAQSLWDATNFRLGVPRV